MANPANTLPPEYDDYQPHDYDPGYTADISTKMRVPHRLSAINGYSGDAPPRDINMMESSAPMQVPERILVAGSEQHIGVKSGSNLNLDIMLDSRHENHVGLQTPPRTLTLEERGFPLAGDEIEDRNKQNREDSMLVMNGSISATPPTNVHMVATPTTPGDALMLPQEEDDFQVMRRQVSKLSRKIAYLEQENDRRSQRELVLYPLVIGYLLFRMAAWLLRNN